MKKYRVRANSILDNVIGFVVIATFEWGFLFYGFMQYK